METADAPEARDPDLDRLELQLRVLCDDEGKNELVPHARTAISQLIYWLRASREHTRLLKLSA